MVIAVSGGGDSVALLQLLLDLGHAERLHLAHFDHGLREASADVATFVAAVAASHALPLATERADVARIAAAKGWNLEDGARRLRYDFLHRVAKDADSEAILTAHTQDDQAETVLAQTLRGAAFAKGMLEHRGKVIRPLLGVSRADLRAFLSERGYDFHEDPSNADTGRTRAWLRHQIVPRMEEQFPETQRALARFSAHQARAAAFVSTESSRRFDSDSVALGALAKAPPAIQYEAVASLLRAARVAVDTTRLETVLSWLHTPEPGRLQLTPDKVLRAVSGRLVVVPTDRVAAPSQAVRTAADLPPGFPADLLRRYRDLMLRSRLEGDRIRLPGGTRKVSNVLIDAKVPREDRSGLRLLASGRDVLWIEGVAVADELVGLGVPHPDPDLYFMRQALEQAELAAAAGELPVGAVVTLAGDIVAKAGNRTERDCDPSAHAEVLALRAAGTARGDWRQRGATLYVTLEPCPMCVGAALQAQVDRIVFGADNLREGALGSVVDLTAAGWKRGFSVRGGVAGPASAKRMRAFFEDKRGDAG